MILQPPPPGFITHVYEFSVNVKSSEAEVWKWLNDPDTFIKGQVWPFRVEFYSPEPDKIPNGFHKGVLNTHHGPLINFPGVITEVSEHYRDLQYNYGSYALSFRWIRPYRLEFFTKQHDDFTQIDCKLSSYVKPWIKGFWNTSQGLFWIGFKKLIRKNLN